MEWYYIYIYGWLIYSHYLVAEFSLYDIFMSHLVGLLWPISLPARVLSMVLK